jgi:hypothetical protein
MSCRREVLPDTPADRLRRLARYVEKLGVCGRTTPESVLVQKMMVARAMRALARELTT